jgi:hypothetical protein
MPRIDNAEIKKEVNFTATAAAGVDNNSIFMDSADDKIKIKDNSGNVIGVGSAAGISYAPESLFPTDFTNHAAKFNYRISGTGGGGTSPWKTSTGFSLKNWNTFVGSYGGNYMYFKESYAAPGAVVLQTYNYTQTSSVSDLYASVDYEVYKLYDECDNSAIDPTLWTTSGTMYEDTVGIYATAAAAGYVTSNDLKTTHPSFTVSYYLVGRWNTQTGYISITDGTSEVQISAPKYGTNTGSGYRRGEIDFFYDADNNMVLYVDRYTEYVYEPSGGSYVNEHSWQDNVKTGVVSVSGWSSVKLRVGSTWSGTSGYVAYLFFLRGIKTALTTMMTAEVSANGGTNWTELERNGDVVSVTAGTKLAAKLSGTVAANEVLVVRNIELGLAR